MTDDDNLIDKEGEVDEDELDRRIRELGLDETPSIERAKQEGNKIDDEFSDRLKALEDKARAAKHQRHNQKREEARKSASDAQSALGLGIGLSVAYTIIGMPLVGMGIGWFIDYKIGSNSFRTIGAVAGMALGIFAGIAIFNKSNRQP
jgi:F0F1-type ATP synthase assembly protein I